MTSISSAHFFSTQNELQRILNCRVQEKEVLWQTLDVVFTTDKDRNFPTRPANVGVLGKMVGGDPVRDVGCDSHSNLTGQEDSWVSNKQGKRWGLS